MRARLALLTTLATLAFSTAALAEEPKAGEKDATPKEEAKDAKAEAKQDGEKKPAKKVRRVEKKEAEKKAEAKAEEAKKGNETRLKDIAITAHGRPVVNIHIEKQPLVFPPHTLVDPSGRPVE